MTADTLPSLFLDRVAHSPDAEAFRFPVGAEWRRLTWREVKTQVAEIAAGLRTLGLEDEGRVGIASSTRMEWVVADLGILCAGGATTTIYPSSTADECAFILDDSATHLVFAEDATQVAKLHAMRHALPGLRTIIAFDPVPEEGDVISLDTLRARGREALTADPESFERRARAVKSDGLATLIYTSGTTGRPKGVELTHDCWVYEGEAVDSLGIIGPDDLQFLWLPLAHSFGKVLMATQLKVGFPTAIDGRVDKIVDNLAVIKPTFVAAVPRIFEKVHAKVVAGASHGMKKKIFDWAFRVGGQVSALRQKGQEPTGMLAFKNGLARKLVFSKLHARFGGRLRFFVSGSAPLAKELGEFFHAAEVLILEGYGLTETSAASFVNRPSSFQFGTVGPPLPGTEVKLAPEDGEVLIKGRGVMRGYHNLPEATAETLTPDGWLRTGDIGMLEDGRLRITDRKKDLIKTSGGKYVAPQNLEARLKIHCPYVSQVLVHGNNRHFCSALIALDPEAIGGWAKDNDLAELDYVTLVQHERVRELIGGYVEEMNKELASFETLKRFAILPSDLSIESGDLTPSLKLKRKAVEQKYAPLLDQLYASPRA